MRNAPIAVLAVCLACLLGVSEVRAQQIGTGTSSGGSSAPTGPLNAWNSTPPPANSTETSPTNKSASRNPLTGAEAFLFGNNEEAHNFFQPRVDYYAQSNSNGFYTVGTAKIVTFYSIYGGLKLDRTSGRSEFTLDYSGGGMLVPGISSMNSLMEQFTASETHRWRRWTLLLNDQYSYLPESAFGSTIGDLGNFGAGISGAFGQGLSYLNSAFSPNQSVLTPNGRRISNDFLSQVEYKLSPRSSLTATGSYGILRFAGPALFNNSEAIFQFGYNHQLSRRETIGLLYRYGGIRLSGRGLAVLDYATQLSFERQFGERLVLRLAVGPEVTATRVGMTGSKTVVFPGIDGSLHYNLHQTDLGLSYLQSVTGGAGVLPGAETSAVSASVGRTVRRFWHGSVGFGYAVNQALATESVFTPGQRFDTWFTSFQISRPVGRDISLFLDYTERRQTSRLPFCTGPVCGPNPSGHQITLGVSWQRRPMPLPW